MEIIVQKYGGTSLATMEKLHSVARRIIRSRHSDERVVVVVSARGKVTDGLLADVAEISSEPPSREVDQLLTIGEQASAAMLAMALGENGVAAISLAGPQTGIKAAGPHSTSLIVGIDLERLRDELGRSEVVVVTGFQGTNKVGDLTTLGRGGSDTTAVALAAALGLDRVEICTDVDAVRTADPRIEPGARPIREIDCALMAEMAHSGARVLHSRSVELAVLYGVDIHVRHSTEEGPGTMVRVNRAGVLEERERVVAVTHDPNVVRIGVIDPAVEHADLLAGMSRLSVPVDFTGPLTGGGSRAPFDVIVAAECADAAVSGLVAAGCRPDSITVDAGIGTVSVVGTGLLGRPVLVARLIRRLAAAGLEPGWITTSDTRISATVPCRRLRDAVAHLHHEFGLHDGPGSRTLASA